MNKNEHLKYFKVKNFKRFKEFELNDIGQFNIIVGDNNTGKTTLLESLLFNKNTREYLISLFKILDNKKLYINDIKNEKDAANYISLFYNRYSKNKTISFTIKYTNSQNEQIIDISELKNIGFLSGNEIEQMRKIKQDIVGRFLRYEDEIYYKKIITTKTNKKLYDIFILSNVGSLIKKIYDNINNFSQYIPFYIAYDFDLVDMYSKYIQPNKDKKFKDGDIIDIGGKDNIKTIKWLLEKNTDLNGKNIIILDADYEKNGGGCKRRKQELENIKKN